MMILLILTTFCLDYVLILLGENLLWSLLGLQGVIFRRHLQPQLVFYVQEFVGNTDQETVVKHELNGSFRARYIRFRPTGWYRHISMRVEVYGCKGNIVGLQEFVENLVYTHQEEKKTRRNKTFLFLDLPSFMLFYY